MKTKRILHISNYYPPHIGGIEYVCHTVVSSQKDCEHAVICFNDTSRTIQDEYENIKVFRVGRIAKIAGQSLSLSYFFHLKSAIKTFKPDIIHFHAPNPLVSVYLLALLPSNIKLIVHYHAEILTSDVLYRCYRPFERKLFGRADVIITTSPKLRDEALPLAAYKHKCEIVENTITTEDLDENPGDENSINALKTAFGNKPIILSFGRHVPYKGLQYLIEAEKFIHADCQIVIGGSGPLSAELRGMTASSRIHFVGRIPDDQLRIYLRAASVFAFPSVTKAEAFGLTLVQAMYCGTPPVTFTIPASGVNYVNIDQITGLEVENGNARQFAEAIDKILMSEELHHRFVTAGQIRVDTHFTIDILAQKITELYRKLI